MYIWRKGATANWLAEHGDNLQARFGSGVAIIEQPGKARSLVQVSCQHRREALDLQHNHGGTLEKLPTDWLQQVTKHERARPLRIGSRLVVTRTAGLEDEKTIVIPAEMAFGTGEHATTAMCLRLVERVTRPWPPGWRMLDAGTGSGILAIAAAHFGAGRIIAIDNDSGAIATARRNAAHNRASRIEFRVGNILQHKGTGRFNLITANLYSEILIPALPGWRRHLARDGRLILSGILRSQERAVVAALQSNRFLPTEIKRRGKWIALLAAPVGKNS